MSFSQVVSMGGVGGTSVVCVNGVKYTLPKCNSISLVNGKIFFDGKQYDEKNDSALSKDMATASKIELHIHPIEGKQVPDITTSANVTVHGNAGCIQSSGGDIEVEGSVFGNVQTTNGNVTVTGDVGGDIATTNGSIRAKTINGVAVRCSPT